MTTLKPLALSVKIVIRDDSGRCLLLKRSMKSKGNPGKWDFPGGKIDAGESFDAAMMREVAEETGLDVFIEGAAGTAQSETPSKRIIYLMLEGRTQASNVRLSDEHDEFAWVDLTELPHTDLAEQFKSFAADYSARFASKEIT